MTLYDKHGIPIYVGDVVKVFHFRAALRRQKFYMFKQAIGIREWDGGFKCMKFSHLTMDDKDYYLEALDGRTLTDYEIVQSIDCDHERRESK